MLQYLNVRKGFEVLPLRGLREHFSSNKGNITYYPFKKSPIKVPAVPKEAFFTETCQVEYLKAYKDCVRLCDDSMILKVSERFMSTQTSFSKVGSLGSFNYPMASPDFYKGDTGCYLFELHCAVSRCVDIVSNHLSKLDPVKEGLKISIGLHHSLYNEIEKVEGPSKRLEVLTREPFSRFKPTYSPEVGVDIYPALAKVIHDIIYLNESFSLFHISAIDFILEE